MGRKIARAFGQSNRTQIRRRSCNQPGSLAKFASNGRGFRQRTETEGEIDSFGDESCRASLTARLIRKRGCCVKNAGRRGITSRTLKLEDVPTRSSPRNSLPPRAAWSASSSAARIGSTLGKIIAAGL